MSRQEGKSGFEKYATILDRVIRDSLPKNVPFDLPLHDKKTPLISRPGGKAFQVVEIAGSKS